MAVVVDNDTRLVVQGLTGSEGRFQGAWVELRRSIGRQSDVVGIHGTPVYRLLVLSSVCKAA